MKRKIGEKRMLVKNPKERPKQKLVQRNLVRLKTRKGDLGKS